MEFSAFVDVMGWARNVPEYERREYGILKIIAATKDYLDEIKNLLASYDLPYDDIDEHIYNFLIAVQETNLVGVVGLEVYSDNALFRSLAVDEAFRSNGVGYALLTAILERAKKLNVQTVYLLTMTAGKYFRKYGFITINRSTVPEAILNTKEFSSLCPISAVCMKRIVT